MEYPPYARFQPALRAEPVTSLAPPSVVYVERPPNRIPLIITIMVIVVIIIVILVLLGVLMRRPAPPTRCAANIDCPNNLLCDQSSGNCYQCLTNANCGNSQARCDPVDHVCKDCQNDSQCPTGAPYCRSGDCITCRDSSDCDQSSLFRRCNQATGRCVV